MCGFVLGIRIRIHNTVFCIFVVSAQTIDHMMKLKF